MEYTRLRVMSLLACGNTGFLNDGGIIVYTEHNKQRPSLEWETMVFTGLFPVLCPTVNKTAFSEGMFLLSSRCPLLTSG